MATAKANTRKIEKKVETIVVEEVIDGVSLTLTATEAQTLFDILRAVGGTPTQSRRGHAQNIVVAMENAGLKRSHNENVDKDGVIMFEDLDADDPRRKDLPSTPRRLGW